MESVSIDNLRPCRICEGLSDDQIARIAATCSWRKLEPQETLTYPGDSVFALYTVIRGRLRMYRGDDHTEETSEERFIGYANLGDTIGQTSLLSDKFDDVTRIVADIDTEVAVMTRGSALRMMFEVPKFRTNLLDAFGVRVESLLQGNPPRRIPKVVGVVASNSAENSRGLLSLLANELQRRGEQVSVLTGRKDQIAQDSRADVVELTDERSSDLLAQIRDRLTHSTRVLVDIMLPRSIGEVREIVDACDEVLWCCENDRPDRQSENMLEGLVGEHPPMKSRIVCVQLLAAGEYVGRREPCCASLLQRDLLLPCAAAADPLPRLQQQGLDRIVRHLRGVKFGLALGGGGARGLAHLGVLKVLDRAGLSFDMISGTSAGAMIGIGYAAGIPPESLIQRFARELQPPSLLDRIRGGRRLYLFAKFRGGAWDELLRKHYHDWIFQQLPIPVSVVSTDLVSGEQFISERGDLVAAILESINVPLMSHPILRDGKILVDGGILNNMPAELLNDRGAHHVIGVDVSKEIPNDFAGNHSGMTTNQMKKPGSIETAYRVMEVSRRGTTRLQMSFADHVIEPDTSAFDFADFGAAQGIAETGEAAAEKLLPQIQNAYQNLMTG